MSFNYEFYSITLEKDAHSFFIQPLYSSKRWTLLKRFPTSLKSYMILYIARNTKWTYMWK